MLTISTPGSAVLTTADPGAKTKKWFAAVYGVDLFMVSLTHDKLVKRLFGVPDG